MSVSVMKKLTVLAPERDTDALLRRLVHLRCVEVNTLTPEELPDGGTLLRYDAAAALAEAERRVEEAEATLGLLGRYADKPRAWRRKPPAVTAESFRATGSYAAARAVVEETLDLRDAIAACRQEYNRLEALRHSLRPWLDYDLPPGEEHTDLCEVWLGTLPPLTEAEARYEAAAGRALSVEGDAHIHPTDAPSVLDRVEGAEALHVAIREVSRASGDAGSERYVSVLLLRAESDAVARALAAVGFSRIMLKDLPSPGTAKDSDLICIRRMGELENQLQRHTDRLRHLSQMLTDVEALYDIEMTALVAARQKQKLLATEQCVLLEGWVPADRDARVAAALGRLPCAFDMTDPVEGEEPPVLLRNNGFASNFEWVVGMYAYPRYGTFDPTAIMSIFYFFIFGIMFADVGYGTLLLLGGLLLPKVLGLKGSLKRMLNMFGYCGISCVLLGLVFGGWFGDLPYALMTGYLGYESAEAAKEAIPFFNGLVVVFGGEPIVFNPLENPILFLVISLVIGAVHLIAGMAVKFCILCKKGEVFAAIFDVGSYWVLFAGIGLIFLAPTAGWITLGVGVLMIVATYGRAQKNIVMKFLMGLKGLYDLISYASDLLSYCRILALGLAAGVVGQVINLLATMGGPSPGGFILLVLILLVGHGLNLAINLLGSFVHTSRLQYLEFFGKFYEDGGVPFDPVLPSEKYTTSPTEPAQARAKRS